MAALEQIHWQTVSEQMKSILVSLGQLNFIKRFYLAGGTALALQIGHRISIDLDFFSEKDEVLEKTREEIIQSLSESNPVMSVIENVDGNLLLQVNQVDLGFFSYGYPLLESAKELDGCWVAGLMDIGLMKLDAIISRGSRKDFYDLYWISQQISITELLSSGKKKYPLMRDFPLLAVEHMVKFENADRDNQPVLIYEKDWEAVKGYFSDQATKLGNEWFFSK